MALHKQNMDKQFTKNQLKPGDPGFQYDKRITFEKGESLDDDSWNEDDEEVKPDEEEDMDYFDDDFE